MLIERDVKGAEEYTKQTISDLLQNRVDLSQLVITKALAKSGRAELASSFAISCSPTRSQTTRTSRPTSNSLSV